MPNKNAVRSRRDYEAAIATKIVCVLGSAGQRSGSFRSLLSARFRRSTRELQDDGWHIDLLRSCELVFPNDAFVAVRLTLHTVLKPVSCFGEQANDLETLPSRMFLTPIRRKVDHLPNRELVRCHRTSRYSVRRAPEKAALNLDPLYCARSATADVLPCWFRSNS
jgi:hypothetical protein